MDDFELRDTELAWPDPLHEQSGPTTFWSTVNLAEAIPGVPTPMSWSIFSIGNEVSVSRGPHGLPPAWRLPRNSSLERSWFAK
jgi:hypothetical protein